MALWNQATPEVSSEKPQPIPPGLTPTPTATATAPTPTPAPTPVVPAPKESAPSGRRESVFGPGVTIEGKIEGDADIRIGGKFKGDIQIKGDLNLDKGAKVSAKVQAANVTIGGELEGNVVAGAQVKLLESGQLIGDLKAAVADGGGGLAHARSCRVWLERQRSRQVFQRPRRRRKKKSEPPDESRAGDGRRIAQLSPLQSDDP